MIAWMCVDVFVYRTEFAVEDVATVGVVSELEVVVEEEEEEEEDEKLSLGGLEYGHNPFNDLPPREEYDLDGLWDTFHRERMPSDDEWEEWDDAGNLGGKKMAYAFYVTSKPYACAATVVMRQLKNLGTRAGFLVVYLKGRLDVATLAMLESEGAVVRAVDPLPFVTRSYYKDVLVKLRIFEQYDYDRLVFMDADTYARGNLDPLFSVRFQGNELIAAPWNYYDEKHHYEKFMPWLMVLEPSKELWHEIDTRFLNQQAIHMLENVVGNGFDGEVLNVAFIGDRSLKLPPQYAILNSEWCSSTRGRTYLYFTTRDADHLDRGLVHFSCWGKPWGHKSSTLSNVTMMEPLYSMYLDWYARARAIGCYTM